MTHPNSNYRLPRYENTEDLVAPKGRSTHTLMHTPNRKVIHLSSHQTFLEFLLSTCVSLSWFRHEPSWLLCHCSLCLLLPELFWHALLSKPQNRPGLLFFLGQTSHRGSRASFPGSTGCSCVHTASGARGLPSLTCFFAYI